MALTDTNVSCGRATAPLTARSRARDRVVSAVRGSGDSAGAGDRAAFDEPEYFS